MDPTLSLSDPLSFAEEVARFEPISLKEMDSVSLLNRVDTKHVVPAEKLAALLTRGEAKLSIVYEKIELLHSSRREEMLADLRSRTGLDIVRVEVNELCFLRDTASITVVHRTPAHPDYREPAQG